MPMPYCLRSLLPHFEGIALMQREISGHSMTIVGFEVRENGTANLLVFDPMFKTSHAMQRLVGKTIKSSNPARLVNAYRRGTSHLRKHKEFEVLK
jgi:zinc finger-containing ubiquitin peptidase 1